MTYITSKNCLTFYNGKNIIRGNPQSYYNYENRYFIDKIDDFVDAKNERKIVIPFFDAFYHFMSETLTVIFYFNQIYKNAFFYIDTFLLNDSDFISSQFFRDFILLLDKAEIKYKVFDSSKPMHLTNFYVLKDFTSLPMIRYSIFYKRLEEIGLFSKNEPYRKVYVSRRKMQHDSFNDMSRVKIKEGMPFEDDNRMYNEEALEEYFKRNGFEIVFAQDMLDLEQKILFFSEIKLLVSPTGAGLSNAIFMAPKTTVIEIAVPMVSMEDLIFEKATGDWSFGIHIMYKEISNIMQQIYLSIFVPDKLAFSTINYINDSSLLKYIIEEQ